MKKNANGSKIMHQSKLFILEIYKKMCVLSSFSLKLVSSSLLKDSNKNSLDKIAKKKFAKSVDKKVLQLQLLQLKLIHGIKKKTPNQ